MKNRLVAQTMGIPISSVAYPTERPPRKLLQDYSASQCHIPSSSSGTLMLKHNKADLMNKLGGRPVSLINCIREHVRLGPKISETVKGKLSLGAKIVKAGGVEKIFKRNFSVREGEKLLKASQCYLSTTAGPIAGLLFISTDKVAFCSERSIKFSSPTGEFIRIRYKVLIPVGKILRANESQNMKRPARKYIELVTVDNFDFWFMGFLNYHKTFNYLHKALSQAQ
ncbi:GEM-like protein [Actinidia chinensis var. chinensis]|uniref:GEM-like protein n=1 Tax=Actinidia chinensis var. chinensis TaxID=1590841 RepID=A0A2R6PGF2_ACTCC|nr:GEM-like protein [Actinidia chinensis var. chinensis]